MSSTPPEPGTFPVLDTLRLVGALGVLTTHVAFWTGTYTSQPVTGPLLARLDVGVAVFFVLSGFLLSRQWISAVAAGRPTPNVRRYLWRRVLRVYPLYVVTAVLALVFIEANADLDRTDAAVTLALAGIYVDPLLPAGLTHMWSLSTEVAFYAALPLLMAIGVGGVRGRVPTRRIAALATLMLVASIAWFSGLAERLAGGADVPIYEWLPAFLGWFGAGIVLALADVLVARGEAPHWLRRVAGLIGSQPGACWVLVLAVMLVAATPLAGPTLLVSPTGTEALTKNLLYLLAGTLVVATGVFSHPGTTYHRVMSSAPLRHLGRTSYSMFCIHLLILHLVRWMTDYELFTGDMLRIFVLTLALTLVASEVLYRVVELPFMRLKDRGPGAAVRSSAPPSAASTR